ncbi:hypothetical protein [Saccharothrix sp. Mg75]|uniref:hypothetical protein n=1 Tax=Saccharothrix sp. Mg75 TaxID=3445357 RepID=UPI003EECD492
MLTCGFNDSHGTGSGGDGGGFGWEDGHSGCRRRKPPARLPGPVDELIRHCAGLPLALGIVAARAEDHPVEELVEELRAAPLDALDLGERAADLRTVLAGTCGALSPDDREALTALADRPGEVRGTAATRYRCHVRARAVRTGVDHAADG